MGFSDQELTLLREVQRDASQSLAELTERCGMAQSTVWRKLQEFEKQGIIQGRVALLDAGKVGCSVMVLVSVTLTDHGSKTLDAFRALVAKTAAITECFLTSGKTDFTLKIMVESLEDYENFMTETLLQSGWIQDVHSAIVMKTLKCTTQLPVR